MKRQKNPGLFYIHAAAILFGFAGLFGKFLDLSPATITCGRTVFGSIALLMVSKFLGVKLRLGRLWSRIDAFRLLFCGFLLATHWFTFFQAIQVSSVAIGLLSFSSFPLFVVFLEPLFFRERLRAGNVALAIVVTAGLVLIPQGLSLGDHVTQGVLWGVLSGFCFALLSLVNRSLVIFDSPLAIAFYQNVVAAVCLAPAAVYSGDTLSLRSLLMLIVLGVVFTGGAHALFIASLQHIRAQLASVITSLEPIYGILFAWLLLGEIPAPRTLLGGAIILGSVFAAMLCHSSNPARDLQ